MVLCDSFQNHVRLTQQLLPSLLRGTQLKVTQVGPKSRPCHPRPVPFPRFQGVANTLWMLKPACHMRRRLYLTQWISPSGCSNKAPQLGGGRGSGLNNRNVLSDGPGLVLVPSVRQHMLCAPCFRWFAGRCGVPWFVGASLHLCLCLHVASSLWACASSHDCLAMRTPIIVDAWLPYPSMTSSYFPLQWLYFQIRPHSEILGVRAFWNGTQSNP